MKKLLSDSPATVGLLAPDDDDPNVKPLEVDGALWPHPIGKVVPFEPGQHTISCGTEVAFVVPAGVVFKFDYWGR